MNPMKNSKLFKICIVALLCFYMINCRNTSQEKSILKSIKVICVSDSVSFTPHSGVLLNIMNSKLDSNAIFYVDDIGVKFYIKETKFMSKDTLAILSNLKLQLKIDTIIGEVKYDYIGQKIFLSSYTQKGCNITTNMTFDEFKQSNLSNEVYKRVKFNNDTYAHIIMIFEYDNNIINDTLFIPRWVNSQIRLNSNIILPDSVVTMEINRFIYN